MKLTSQQGFDASLGGCHPVMFTGRSLGPFLGRPFPKQWKLSSRSQSRRLSAQSTPALGAVESQQQIMENAATFSFMIKGVSFDGRQQPLRSCHPGQALMLVHEPANPYDALAKAIKLLDGTMLGYVPRDINHYKSFHRPESFGQISSLGPAMNTDEPELFGARVTHRGNVNPLTALALPDKLQTACREFMTFLPGSLRERISKQYIEKTRGRCFISLANKDPLTVVPVWKEDEENKTFSLIAIVPISKTLKVAQDKFLDQESSDSQALQTYQQMNGWTEEEARMYRGYKQAVVKARNAEDWRLDLSRMKGVINLPSDLKDLEVES